MTNKQHKERHKLLHKELDELVADHILHTGRRPSETTMLEFMLWSFEQTTDPTAEKKA